MNKYRNPDSSIIGAEGMGFNEGTRIEEDIEFEDYGVFTNDNTYSITFNPYYNRPKIKIHQQESVRPPKSNQHITKPSVEPPVQMTDNWQYIRNDKAPRAPILPPYLKKPAKEQIQGAMNEKDKGNIIYGPQHKVNIENINY